MSFIRRCRRFEMELETFDLLPQLSNKATEEICCRQNEELRITHLDPSFTACHAASLGPLFDFLLMSAAGDHTVGIGCESNWES